MHIGIFGAGVIGCYLGGTLAAQQTPVTLLTRPKLEQEIAQHGLRVQSLEQGVATADPAHYQVTTDLQQLAHCDLILVTVKSKDTGQALTALQQIIPPQTPVVSFQNGVRNAETLRDGLSCPVIAGMVPYNVVRPRPGFYHQVTSGRLVLEKHSQSEQFKAILVNAGLDTELRADMQAVQWSKLIINLNNSVNALARLPLKDMLLQSEFRRVVAMAQKEALTVTRQAKIKLVRLGALYPPLLPDILRLPTPIFKLVASASLNIHPDATSSMQDDLCLGRTTEIDHLNGEIATLGVRLGIPTPVNDLLIRRVKECEQQGTSYSGIAGVDLLSQANDAQRST